MKKLFVACLASLPLLALSADIEGDWLSVDDETGEQRSRITISQAEDGTFVGNIAEIYNPSADPSTLRCSACTGELKDQPMIGLPLLWGLTEKNGEYTGGHIVDPESGKEYKLKAKINGDGNLEVRGFIGFSLIGRTQVWLPATP
ncbi:DUF2147 domain-containing protein [Salinibius halmophilus]|uniref:DUF2147 domain-containing protein n=1 Tax=Salinibius halmophilus TaxID=1853216 RepID=UPI000E672BBA|nr:DUF2147 domain-containing protein [Salinibius halmophilus]